MQSKRTKWLQITLISLCLMTLTSCSTPPSRVLVKTEFISVLPPASLIQDRPAPIWHGGNNKDLIEYILELQSVVFRCNNDKKLLREYRDERIPNKN